VGEGGCISRMPCAQTTAREMARSLAENRIRQVRGRLFSALDWFVSGHWFVPGRCQITPSVLKYLSRFIFYINFDYLFY
jgi:hypothetical protein